MRNFLLSILCGVLFLTTDTFAQRDDDWLVMGMQSLKFGSVNQALNNYNNHIETFPTDPLGYIYRARLNETIGNLAESELDLRIAQRLNPLSLMIVDPGLRSKFSAKKNYDFNFNNLDNAFVKSPSRYQDYKKVFDQLELNHSQDTRIEMVIQELNNLNINEAEKLLEKVEINDNNEAIVNDLYGKVFMKRGDYNTAIDYFTLSIEAAPLFSIAYHNRSLCYQLLGQMELAQDDLSQAIGLNDEISMFYFTQAKLNEKLGDKDAAISNYEDAISIDQDYQEALINYSQLLKGLGDYNEGLKYLNRAVEEIDNDMESTFLEANLNFIYGEYEKAIDGYNSYLLTNQKDPSAIFNRGLSQILLRRTQDGCSDLKQSIELDLNKNHENLLRLFCNQGISFFNSAR